MTPTKGRATLGPWHVEQYGRARTLICSADDVMDGAILAEIDPTSAPDGEANARLIAASPMLLEALRAFVFWLKSDARYYENPNLRVTLEQAETAIRAAEGE